MDCRGWIRSKGPNCGGSIEISRRKIFEGPIIIKSTFSIGQFEDKYSGPSHYFRLRVY